MKNLEVINVCKKYKKFELKKVTFSVESGSITGFIGRNGAGKTTTLKGIMDLLHFDSGEVKVFGNNFYDNEFENKQKISFSLSEINYYPECTLKRLTDVTKRFYSDWDDEIYEKICRKFNLDGTKKVKELSSGMKVKYNLAIALSHNAKLLILDEPTSGLDPVSRDEILDIFKMLIKNKDRAILFSTHITTDLEKCADHIVYLRKGEVIADKNKEDFINQFLLITCNEKDFGKIKDKVISHKVDNGIYEALLNINDAKQLNKNYKKKKPSLEEIMVYEERSDEDEEFII